MTNLFLALLASVLLPGVSHGAAPSGEGGRLPSGEPRVLRHGGSGIFHLAFTPDGREVVKDGLERYFLDGSSAAVVIPGRQLAPKAFSADPSGSIALSANGNRAIGLRLVHNKMFGMVSSHGVAVFRSGMTPDWVLLPADPDHAHDTLLFSPDGRTLVGIMSLFNNRVWVWDAMKGGILRKLDLNLRDFDHPSGIAFSPDGLRLFVAAKSSIHAFDTTTWNKVSQMISPDAVGDLTSLAITADGNTLAAGQWNGPIHIYDSASGSLKATLKGHKEWVYGLSFSPDGRLLASGSSDKTARLWDLASGRERAVLASHTDKVTVVAFSPDGSKLATTGFDGKILLYEVRDIPEGTFVAPKPNLPASLSLTVSFQEPSGDGYLDAGEKGALKVETSNAGPGEAHGVTLSLEFSGPAGISVERRLHLGALASGAKSVTDIPINASQDAASGSASLSVEAKEANGFDSQAMKVEFSVRAFRNPKLEVAGVSLAGGDVVKANQVTRVTVQVRNSGSGPAKAVRAALHLGPEIFMAGEKDSYLGDLKAGDTAKASFEFFVNARFKGKTLPAYLDLSEETGRFGVQQQSLGLALGEAPTSATLTVKTREDAPVAPAVPSESVDSPPATATPMDPNAFAVVIGIERYREEGIPPVDFAARDARAFASYLTKSMGFDSRNVILLVDAKADRTDIEKYLGKWLKNRVKPDSRVMVYFAGHGAPNPETGEGFILPYSGDPAYTDETAFPLKKFYAYLDALPTRDVTVVLDACFSGRGSRSVLAKGARPLVQSRAAAAGSNTVVLAATGSDQISTHFPDAEHGMLTYFLLKALRGEADADKDGRVTTREIYDFVLPSVEREARKLNVEQTPTISPSRESLGPKAGQVWIRLK
ncbi:MAG: caspase family protein [Elusimicrobia bacterium]|nr:caspase family protein [Elusimicrobiota bacterium]